MNLDVVAEILPPMQGAVQIFDGIDDDHSFKALAESVGKPIFAADGTCIKELHVTDGAKAPRRSFSAKFGAGPFPFHTDTAFWGRPARFVLLRAVSGDFSRATHVKSFQELLIGVSPSVHNRSIWMCDTGVRKFLTTFSFHFSEGDGSRFDPECMQPVNTAAMEVYSRILERCFVLDGTKVEWQPNRVAIIPNWTHLHARGGSIAESRERLLQRIYVM